MANNNIGPKRLVVGAHYGLRDWMGQRVTAIVMAIYTVILLVTFLSGNNFSYEGWAGLFSHQWFKLATFVTFLSLLYHAWVGMRNIWMDYVTKSVAARLVLQVVTLLWLIGCAGWAAQIIWRV
ncbi:succinate dehydrogenase, hydrophobic membrane anchor protein [Noviherbaspirillum sp. CPCC 100848]|uniref:Succinate dehydrogenase hydrophobic membrane anchor subunit n=1 Tax=Noviherbaspirillum album TaxID=3080276 RepID=A0ABU6JJK4_9BURK|nr:succinate dehydrogenase, hydrophobic membrane anchor protein [Noviherbaspirillum sp. CPCC 100848]MEC4723872.1 succinate dehydrogenase, hydrophobic membrane anchor protein [Noviherbaspirillum sp. CPCC 100848]